MSHAMRLATALMVMASLPACKPMEDVFTMLNGGEPDVTQKMQGAAYVPPPEPPCEDYSWRYNLYTCKGELIGPDPRYAE